MPLLIRTGSGRLVPPHEVRPEEWRAGHHQALKAARPKRLTDRAHVLALDVLADWPDGALGTAARRLLAVVRQADRAWTRRGTVPRALLGRMVTLEARLVDERAAHLAHARRMRQGGRVGRHIALYRFLQEWLRKKDNAAVPRLEVWRRLRRLAEDTDHDVLHEVSDTVLSWLDHDGNLHKVSQRTVFNQLPRLRPLR